LYHELWDPPSPADLKEGWNLVEAAEKAREKSPREDGYIASMSAYYQPGNRTYAERATAYNKAMEKLHDNYPSDEEATIFYALSLLAAEPATDTSLVWAKNAVTILNGVLAKDPDHPGVAHYLIHSCDNPHMAAEGLAAARRYAILAPYSPHALHMPSHIFTRLGLWQDDINSNLAAIAAAEHGPWDTGDRLHPMDFLEYAYLQTGQDDKARAVEADAVALKETGYSADGPMYYDYVQAHYPALLALETRNWKAAESLEPTPHAEPGFQAMTFRAQAIAAGHLRDVAAAQAAVQNLDNALAASRKLHPDLAVSQVDTEKSEGHAWLAFAQGNTAEAFRLLQPVIQIQDEIGKGEVELPAREMYADMLLESQNPKEALEQYRLSLKTDPNRFNGLYGAGRSAELAQEPSVAAGYYKQLLDNCQQGEGSDRMELDHARKFISQTAPAAK
ncbi:MAG: tetratricopeptide repeat protein, partial [Candidatus Acidiferrales bacterium]